MPTRHQEKYNKGKDNKNLGCARNLVTMSATVAHHFKDCASVASVTAGNDTQSNFQPRPFANDRGEGGHAIKGNLHDSIKLIFSVYTALSLRAAAFRIM